ncbi:class F sortase [Streptomyces sp. 6N223]|uniref:class F sortase n=1 Tax=Streptomyces sp. 6N223 TaxID=3457412 RepID=UPI003FD41DD5
MSEETRRRGKRRLRRAARAALKGLAAFFARLNPVPPLRRLILALVRPPVRLVRAVVAAVARAVRTVRRAIRAVRRAAVRSAVRAGRAVRRCAATCRRHAVAPFQPLSHAPNGASPSSRNRQQRMAVRSRRLEVAAVLAAATVGLLAAIYGPGGQDGVREARASSSIAEGVSRPGAVDAPAAAPNSGSTAGLDPISAGQPPSVVAAPLSRSVPVRIRIPQLGTDAEVIGADLSPDGGPPTPSEADAMRAAWYAGGVSPGESGAAILVGHLDTYDGPAAFSGLGQLRPGETIEIDRVDGTTAVFAVDSVEQYPKTDFPDLRVYGAVDTPQLRLITCGGAWTADGGYDSNIVAYAHLTPRGT